MTPEELRQFENYKDMYRTEVKKQSNEKIRLLRIYKIMELEQVEDEIKNRKLKVGYLKGRLLNDNSS